MSTQALIDPGPTGKRMDPVGTENPAMYTESKTDLLMPNGDLMNSEKLGKGVDVLYKSGMTTIRIAGTPVNKRRQFFEDKSSRSSSLERPEKPAPKLKENVPNSIKNSILKGNDPPTDPKDFAITTNIPIDPEIKDEDIKPETVVTDLNGNDVTADYNEQNSPKRKKVSFHDAVVINEDEVAKLANSSEDNSQRYNTKSSEDNSQKYNTSVEEVEIFYTETPNKDKTSQYNKDGVYMNGNVTPIVDELELRQLSERLSSKEKQGPFLPAPPLMNSVNNSMKSNKILSNNTSDNFTSKSKDSSNNLKNSSSKSKKKKSKHKNNLCLWMAVGIIVIAVAGLLVLGILYAVRFSSESKTEVIRVLTNKLSLQSAQAGDLFNGGLVSSTPAPPNIVYHAVENPQIMTWQKPGNITVMSWHKGGVLRLVSLPVTAGGQVTTQLLGDVAKETDVSYSLTLFTDRWYAAELYFDDSYCVFSISHTGSGSIGWTKASIASLEQLHASHKDTIQKYKG